MKMNKRDFIIFTILITFSIFLTALCMIYPETRTPNYYSYTRILCGKGYCVDVKVECDGNKVLNITIVTQPEFTNRTYFSELGWCEWK